MFAEEFAVLDAQTASWQPMRPLLDWALRLESDADLVWHGWQKSQIEHLLSSLPEHCSVLFAIWQADEQGNEHLALSAICEVRAGEIASIRSFAALTELKAAEELLPGYEDAMEILRLTRAQVAPVAWAIFTDKATWDELVLNVEQEKPVLLDQLQHEGRCVLLGSQVKQHHPLES